MFIAFINAVKPCHPTCSRQRRPRQCSVPLDSTSPIWRIERHPLLEDSGTRRFRRKTFWPTRAHAGKVRRWPQQHEPERSRSLAYGLLIAEHLVVSPAAVLASGGKISQAPSSGPLGRISEPLSESMVRSALRSGRSILPVLTSMDEESVDSVTTPHRSPAC